MRISFLPLVVIVAFIPSTTLAQQPSLQPAKTVNSSAEAALREGILLGDSIAPAESSLVSTNEWIGTESVYVPPTPVYWSHNSSFIRPRILSPQVTLAPMVTRAPIMASPVLAAPMIMSVKGPERYNYASPKGYSPARGGFIFGRRGRR